MIFFEHLEQIESLNLAIEFPNASKYNVEITAREIRIKRDTYEKRFPLPISIKPNSARISTENNYINIQLKTLQLNHKKPKPAHFDIPNSIFCHQCEHPFFENFEFERTLELPSEFWYEMSDCWACHHEDYTNLHGQVGGLIYAQKNVLLNSIGYYMIHPENVISGNLKVNITGRESVFKSTKWVDILCDRCNFPVAEAFVNPLCEKDPEFNDLQTIKFFKYRINQINPQKEITFEPFSKYFVKDLIESANHHATYRFALCNEETGRDALLLWVLNWKSECGYSNGGLSKLEPAIKLLYLTRNSESEILFENWDNDKQVDRMQYPLDCLSNLLFHLKECNRKLPPSRRELNSFKVAHLNY